MHACAESSQFLSFFVLPDASGFQVVHNGKRRRSMPQFSVTFHSRLHHEQLQLVHAYS